MYELSKIFDKLSAGLLVLTGILHIFAPMVLGVTFKTLGMVLFGVIYFALGILVLIKDQKMIMLLSIILPLIGMIAGAVILFTAYSIYLLFMVILDPIIIILRILVNEESMK